MMTSSNSKGYLRHCRGPQTAMVSNRKWLLSSQTPCSKTMPQGAQSSLSMSMSYSSELDLQTHQSILKWWRSKKFKKMNKLHQGIWMTIRISSTERAWSEHSSSFTPKQPQWHSLRSITSKRRLYLLNKTLTIPSISTWLATSNIVSLNSSNNPSNSINTWWKSRTEPPNRFSAQSRSEEQTPTSGLKDCNYQI